MRYIKIKCDHCGKSCKKCTGHVNRARKLGAKLFCSQKCFGLDRRVEISDEEKKKNKQEYDKAYREKNLVRIKSSKKAYFKKDYAAHPEKYRAERQRRMKDHIEYCRRPEYKEYKHKYDQTHRAKKDYGEFWECFLIIKEIKKQYDDKEVRQINNLHNKSQKRKRLWQQMTNSNLQRTT